jgi:hypothetical protein
MTGWLDPPQDEVERKLREGLELARGRAGDEIARRRLWTRLAEPSVPPPRRRPLFWVATLGPAALGLAALAFAIVPRTRPEAEGPKLVASAPEAEGSTAGIEAVARPQPAPTEDRPMLSAGSHRTRSRQRLGGRLRSGVHVDIEPNSELVLDAHERPIVRDGWVGFEVPVQPPGERFSVGAGAYDIVVVGTRFKVRVDGGHVGVDVDEGVVEVWRGDVRLDRIPAGERWSSPGPGDGRGAGARKRRTPDGSGPRASAVSSRRLAQAGEGVVLPVPGAVPMNSVTPSAGARMAPAQALLPELPGPPATPAAHAPALGRPADPFREAQAAMARGQTERAIAMLSALADGQGPTAENASYELGLLLRDQLLKPREAVKRWRSYRTRFPNGLLRAEADLSILDTLVSLGETEAALGEAEEFLRRHPRNERHQEVSVLAARLRATLEGEGAGEGKGKGKKAGR